MNTICYRFGLYKIPDKLGLWLAHKVPHRLVKWCLVRAWVHATQGEWSHEEAPAVTMDQVSRRWEKK